jgi:F-type H+-transporting ATPase subunit b
VSERLLAQAREAADATTAARAKTLQTDAEQLRDDISRHAQAQVFDISRRVLTDLADVGLEQRACEVFLQRLHAIDGAARITLGVAVKAATEATPAVLRSAFALPVPQQAAIQAALDDLFGQPIALTFETAPELVSGIELCAQGQKLAWHISDYLAAFSDGLEAHLRLKAPT